MKKIALILVALAGIAALSGCVAYPVGYDAGHPVQYQGHGGYGYGDRDGDGVRNRDDRRPNDPRRY
ncbi:MAG: hypothetical protein ABIP46_03415 [Polaromonas sp.]